MPIGAINCRLKDLQQGRQLAECTRLRVGRWGPCIGLPSRGLAGGVAVGVRQGLGVVGHLVWRQHRGRGALRGLLSLVIEPLPVGLIGASGPRRGVAALVQLALQHVLVDVEGLLHRKALAKGLLKELLHLLAAPLRDLGAQAVLVLVQCLEEEVQRLRASLRELPPMAERVQHSAEQATAPGFQVVDSVRVQRLVLAKGQHGSGVLLVDLVEPVDNRLQGMLAGGRALRTG
ncbi:MAG: hypothetical protein ABS53_04950 [Hydrogenophaga sp. SCN 70-13]|nr:MAG: hypothetical protein ABS53_04950 [Hydrogenophaga sp. SCN 70-13]